MKLRFDEITLDTDARQVFGTSGERHLSAKAFELLKLLVEKRPKALSKRELQERLWPDTFVAETNLASLIAEIRVALGDDARQPRFVRTVHRFGYAFCGVAALSAELVDGQSRGAGWLVWGNRLLALAEGDNVLGRTDSAGICLDAETVSRRHARIVVRKNEVVIEDLGSKNGTFVAGKRLRSPRRLVDGDRIRFGSISVTFHTTEPEIPTQTLS